MMGSKRRYSYMTCEECDRPCERRSPQQRWCPDCRPAARRRHHAAKMRNRRRTDPEFRAYQLAWRQAHPEKIKEHQASCYNRPCPRCGLVRNVSNAVGKEAKAKRLCRKCSALARREIVWLRCQWCRGVFMRRKALIGEAARHHHCAECYGIMTRVAPMLGLTRERVRQLVNKEYARLNRDGHWATRAEALAGVMENRGHG